MRWAHLKAILWMRWRVIMNRLSRRGKTGHVLMVILSILATLMAASSFLGAMGVGVELLEDARPVHAMLAWGGITVVLLFCWMVGVMMELQRSESMSFQSLLHLPASLLGVHLYNYIGSFVSLSLFFVLPLMLGLACASVYVYGVGMLLLFPLIAGFVCLLTALTYQLRGWLGTMMSNKRKRKNVITMITFCFVLLIQVPNLINIMARSDSIELKEVSPTPEIALSEQELRLEDQEPAAQGIVQAETTLELDAREQESPVDDRNAKRKLRRERELATVESWVTRVGLVVPFGWLTLGARSLYEGNWHYGMAFACGMFLLTCLSLRRSYRTTLAFVTGLDTGKGKGREVLTKPTVALRPSGSSFMERELPFVGEPATCIALAGIRNLWKAPEFKMLLLGPLLLVLLGGVMLFNKGMPEVSAQLRPGVGLGAILMGLISMLQLLQNQFGMDRDGFRAFLLSPIPRRKILLGKNLAAAPFALGIGAVPLVMSQLIVPMGFFHFVSTLLLAVAGFLLICIGANQVSIISPMRFKEGAMQPANAKFKVIIMQLMCLLLTPILLMPISFPMGLEALGRFFGFGDGLPLYHLSSVLVLLVCLALYRFVLPKQGRLLQRREQRILDVLTRAVD